VDQDGNPLSDETFAAKVISKNRISRPQQREKVDIEVELMAEVGEHPNIVNFLDSFEDENCVCILLELCRKKVSFKILPIESLVTLAYYKLNVLNLNC